MDITDKIVSAYIDDLYKCDNDKLRELRSFAEENRVPIILKSTEMLLTNLFKIRKPQHILEIGAAVGYSSSVFTDSCGCHVTTIEADENSYNIAVSNIKALGLNDKITVLHGDARNVLQELALKPERFDVVFIDAAKSKNKQIFEHFEGNLSSNGKIITDNLNFHGCVKKDLDKIESKNVRGLVIKIRDYIEFLKNNPRYTTTFYEIGDGLSVSERNELI